MRALWLTHEQARAIARYARDDAPREACGVIGGREDRAGRIIPVTNAAADPLHHYALDNAELTRALMLLRRDGLDIIGFYHSHPTDDPIPSQTDIAQATYPDTAYLIVGLKRAEPELAAWKMRYGDVQRLPLHIGDEPPPSEPPLSRAQKVAIILSALLALAVLLIISLALLPPAPEIVATLR